MSRRRSAPSGPEHHRQAARQFEADFAAEPEEVLHLFEAAHHWRLAGEHDRALAVLDRVRESALEEDDVLSADVETVAVLVDAGRGAEAGERLERLRTSRPEPAGCVEVAELLEEVGDLPAARRWFDQALAALPEEELAAHRAGVGAWETAYLLRGRRRVRHALGLPPDVLDLAVDLPEG